MIWTWPDSQVVRIIDGDSFEAQLTRDIGFHGTVTFRQRLRLNRINAPALKSPNGLSAKALFFDLAFSVPGASSPLLVRIDTVKPYKYGDEWMAEVTLSDGTNVSDVLVERGLAVYWDGTGPRPSDLNNG
jgi:endonuclease YncB( thermonuclease family)